MYERGAAAAEEQTPGLIIPSKHTLINPSSPADAFIWDWYHNQLPTPLNLPVAASRHTLSTQHLRKPIKSLWMIRIWLDLISPLHPPVPLRQMEVSVCCVWIQCEVTGVWWRRRQDKLRYLYVLGVCVWGWGGWGLWLLFYMILCVWGEICLCVCDSVHVCAGVHVWVSVFKSSKVSMVMSECVCVCVFVWRESFAWLNDVECV